MSVSLSPPTYTLTVADKPYKFVFDPLRYASVERVTSFLTRLKAGLTCRIHINDVDDMWTSGDSLQLGTTRIQRTPENVQMFAGMLECALLRGAGAAEPVSAVEVPPNILYPWVRPVVEEGVIMAYMCKEVYYSISQAEVARTTDPGDRITHLRKFTEGRPGILTTIFHQVRMSFNVSERKPEVVLTITDRTRMHRISCTAAQAHEFLFSLYALAPCTQSFA